MLGFGPYRGQQLLVFESYSMHSDSENVTYDAASIYVDIHRSNARSDIIGRLFFRYLGSEQKPFLSQR